MSMTRLMSSRTLLPFQFYDLPFCPPVAGAVLRSRHHETLGEVLLGRRMDPSPYPNVCLAPHIHTRTHTHTSICMCMFAHAHAVHSQICPTLRLHSPLAQMSDHNAESPHSQMSDTPSALAMA